MCTVPPRRAVRGTASKMPSFSLQLPTTKTGVSTLATNQPVPVEEIKAKDTDRLFIDLDGSMISPFMTTEPGWGNGAAEFDAKTAPPPKPQSRKFLRVDDKNLFIYIAGQDDADSAMKGADQTPTSKSTGVGELTTESGSKIDAPSFEDLELGHILGAGSQGTIRACRHNGTEYAIKQIPVSDALDRSQADVERQARKAGIVRELRILAKRTKQQRRAQGGDRQNSDYVVAVYNAYFQQRDLLILMERMNSSLEDLQKMLDNLDWNTVKSKAQKIFDHHISGVKQAGTPASTGSGSMVWEDLDSTGRSSSTIVRSQFSGQSTVSTPGASGRNTFKNYYAGAKIELERGPGLPECVLGLIVNDALRGLCYLHDELRVVHTDLKPANLMFCQNQMSVKLADFGCNMELNDEGFVPHNSGPMLGTKLYMSPERWDESGEGFDAKSDIWSLGICIMELANGCHPCVTFQEDFWSFVNHLKIEKMVRPVTCTELFYDFLKKCLVQDPQNRPSAKELLQHDFVLKYAQVPRSRNASFLKAIAVESKERHARKQKERMQSLLNVAVKTKDNDLTKKSKQKWTKFNSNEGIGSKRPSLDDFPDLLTQ